MEMDLNSRRVTALTIADWLVNLAMFLAVVYLVLTVGYAWIIF